MKEAGGKLLTLLISAGTLVGFVAFAGSVVLWTRFDAVQVPPEQVVDAVPQGESIAVGSVMLLLFGFFGVIAVLGVFLIDRGGRATPGMSRGLMLLLMIEGVVAIWLFEQASADAVIAAEVLVLLLGVALWCTFVGPLIRLEEKGLPDWQGDEGEQDAEDRPFRKANGDSELTGWAVFLAFVLAATGGALVLVVTLGAGGSSEDAWIFALAALGALLVLAATFQWIRFYRARDAERRTREEEARAIKEAKKEAWDEATWVGRRRIEWEEKLRGTWRARWNRNPFEKRAMPGDEEERRKPPRLELSPLGSMILIPLMAAAIIGPSVIVGSGWLAGVLGSVILLGVGLWRLAALTKERFIWYGMAVFISVPLFGTLALMARNVADPQVQPMALIRNTDGADEAIQGIYVTETSDRVYFANVATEGCTDEVKADSGRLLWVPRKEVVAMSIGPLQDVGDVGRSALEMSYALTPSVETPAAGPVSLTVPEKRSKKIEKAEEARAAKEAEAHSPRLDQRLENSGPAVRPTFGSGLSLVPEIASPDGEVELRLSVPNDDVNGFGAAPNGHTLRLNGVPLTILREATRDAGRAEYVKTTGGTVLSLDKKGVYRIGVNTKKPYPLEDDEAATYGGRRFVKLDEGSAFAIEEDGGLKKFPRFLEVKWSKGRKGAELAHPLKVKLEDGSVVSLEPFLLRQAWDRNAIRFRVPHDASSGVVTLECDQLAGSPLLRVSHTPTARIAVRMRQNSAGVRFDSSRSSDGDGEEISRRWTIEGLGRGHRKEIATRLPPRLGAYSVELTVIDEAGNTDTAQLQLLRLPLSMFGFDQRKPHRPKPEQVQAARKSLEAAVALEPPAAIELDGHADNPGTPSYNLKLSLERDDEVRNELLSESNQSQGGGPAVPVQEMGYGETCPIDPRPGRRARNRRVEVFVLGPGVTVKPARGCIPGRMKSVRWHPPAPPSP